MKTVEGIKATITSDCICESVYDDPETGDEVWSPASDCFGCYDESVEALRFIVEALAKSNNFPSETVRIEGVGMGWQRLDGYKIADVRDVPESLNLNGDFRVVFTLNGAELTAERWSHDEPMGGAVFAFTFVDDEEAR